MNEPSSTIPPTARPSIEGGRVEERPTESEPPALPWWSFIQDDTPTPAISSRLAAELKQIVDRHAASLQDYCVLGLLESTNSIDEYDLNHIFKTLTQKNADRQKDVLLILLSPGGKVEPAYQISKLCEGWARSKFVVAVPREAKSAATLISLGADEIHMGPLSQLGPIDPQLRGLPALGVSQALRVIASMAEQYPASAEMFAKYLKQALTVEQIGYCERIGESAQQYAQKLLLRKSGLNDDERAKVAYQLVHGYKDHGFVIDIDEARRTLGKEWIKEGTPEMALAEEIYNLFDKVNFALEMKRKQRVLVIGDLTSPEDVVVLNSA